MKLFKLLILGSLLLLAACSTTKFVPEREYLLEEVKIMSDDSDLDASQLEPYIRQKANSAWFSFLKIPLGAYSLSGKDSTKWINRTLKKLGEKPVIYDSLQAKQTCEALTSALRSMGYLNAKVDLDTRTKGKKLTAIYTLRPGTPYYIGSVKYDIQDENIRQLMRAEMDSTQGLRPGMPFTTSSLDQERVRVTGFLNNRGYMRFHKGYIHYTADTIRGQKDIAVTLHLRKYQPSKDAELTEHPRYTVRDITYAGGDSTGLHLRESVLRDVTALRPGNLYSEADLQRTYNNFGRLQAVRYTNIQLTEVPDTNLVDCHIQVTNNKPSMISFQLEGTNTAGDLGAAASLTYSNRNLFKGSEQFSLELRGAFEAITGLEGYQDQDYQEYSAETKLVFPRFLAPFLSRSFRRRQTANTEYVLSWNMQNRPEFHRRVFTAAWRYRWSEPKHHLSYRFDLLDLNYVYMPWISTTFREDYLDDVDNRNAILRYNYEDLFIMKLGFGITYNTGINILRLNAETSGNLLNALSPVFDFSKNDQGQRTLFNIAYAQYARFDMDYTHYFYFSDRDALVFHGALGIAYPYGNSDVLPFEKRYFTGGANSMRGWGVRELGPGSFRGTDGRIDFINQTGDLKIDFSLEYRAPLFWKFDGAVFVDAGNIWTLRAYEEQPGGQFHFNTFYEQIAVAYGLGLRLNFGYFILRFDMGMKAINPAYNTQQEHYAIFHPDFSRDFSFHFAVGLPF